MAIEEESLVGFRGGMASRKNPMDFGEEQWSDLYGFVIEDGGVLRSQWALHELTGLPAFQALQLDGRGVSTPHDASLETSPNFDVRVLITPDKWAAGHSQAIVAKAGSLGNHSQHSWALRLLGDGRLSFTFSNGTTFFSKTSPSPLSGGRQWVAATRTTSSGFTRLWVSVKEDPEVDVFAGNDWTQLGSMTKLAEGQSINSTTEPVSLGGIGADPFNKFIGRIHAMKLSNFQTQESAVAKPDFRDPGDGWQLGDDETTPARNDPHDNPWSLEGDAVITLGEAADHLATYEGRDGNLFLLAIPNGGVIHWTEAPSGVPGSLNWRELLDDDGDPTVAPPGLKPITTVPIAPSDTTRLVHASGGMVSSLILSSIHLSDGDRRPVVYQSDGGDLRASRFVGQLPPDDETNVVPKGEHGILWSGVTIYGDIEWKDNPNEALGLTNKTRYPNGMWMSVPGEPLKFDPLSVLFIGDAHSKITGFEQTDQGLLVFTSAASTGLGGVWILRGTPDSFVLEPLRVGIGAMEHQSLWQETSTVCWQSEIGEVLQTDGQEIVRLDRQGLTAERAVAVGDGVIEFGPWLLVTREGRLFALRALDDGRSAAWTELAVDTLPGRVNIGTAVTVGNRVFLIAGARMFMFDAAPILGEAVGEAAVNASKRGHVFGEPIELRVGTRTLATGEGHRKTFWHRVGVRATAGRPGTDAELKRLILRAGPVLDDRAPSLVRSGPWSLEEDTQPLRFQSIVRGIGASNEFSVQAVFQGDVIAEQFSIFFNGSILGGDQEGR